jgi:peptidyl-prolyl cis-trans isomerase D
VPALSLLAEGNAVPSRPLSEVRDDIAAKVKQEKALDTFYALQQKVSDAASNLRRSYFRFHRIS